VSAKIDLTLHSLHHSADRGTSRPPLPSFIASSRAHDAVRSAGECWHATRDVPLAGRRDAPARLTLLAPSLPSPFRRDPSASAPAVSLKLEARFRDFMAPPWRGRLSRRRRTYI